MGKVQKIGKVQRLVGPQSSPEEEGIEPSLRPKTLDEYIGQKEVVKNLTVYLKAAVQRGEPLDHVLLSGPPGLGKTTLAHIIAKEMGGQLRVTSGPAIERPIDLLVLLNSLRPQDVLFIDEIHRMQKTVEEILYPAMEDYSFDRVLSKGAHRGAFRHKLSPFTLIGATTRSGLLSAPFRSRFGILFHLEFYDHQELAEIVRRSAGLLDLSMESKGALEIARRCRGTPRIANRLLRRVRDFAEVAESSKVDQKLAGHALDEMGVDSQGLDRMDQRILNLLCEHFGGRAVGLSTLAAAIHEESNNLEEAYEPYLLSQGFLQKTPRGRKATRKSFDHLGIPYPFEES